MSATSTAAPMVMAATVPPATWTTTVVVAVTIAMMAQRCGSRGARAAAPGG